MTTRPSPETPAESAQAGTVRQFDCSGAPVYLFGTCLLDAIYPRAGLDSVALLELCGHEVIYLPDQTCCGQPAYNAGASDDARAVAAHTLNLFAHDTAPLIVPSASCAGMIKHHYTSLFRDDAHYLPMAHALAERTFELIDFIADKLPFDQLAACTQRVATQHTVGLHISCSARREMQVGERWRSVLAKLPHVDIAEPANAEECCGFGGTFAVTSPALSTKLTADKARALRATTSHCITSGDCGCLMNIGSYLAKQDGADPCLHLASLLADAFGVAAQE